MNNKYLYKVDELQQIFSNYIIIKVEETNAMGIELENSNMNEQKKKSIEQAITNNINAIQSTLRCLATLNETKEFTPIFWFDGELVNNVVSAINLDILRYKNSINTNLWKKVEKDKKYN